MYFWAIIFKSYCHIWNQHSRICLIAKFREIIKMPNFGAKNALFVYFWAIIFKSYCHIWNQHSRICLIAKFREIIKMPNFGTKNTLFEYFWARRFKSYCHIWNQHSRICLIANLAGKKLPNFGQIKLSRIWMVQSQTNNFLKWTRRTLKKIESFLVLFLKYSRKIPVE